MTIYRDFVIDIPLYKTAIDGLVDRFKEWHRFTDVTILGVWLDQEGNEVFADKGIEYDLDTKYAKVDGDWINVNPINGTSKIRISGTPISDNDPTFLSEIYGTGRY